MSAELLVPRSGDRPAASGGPDDWLPVVAELLGVDAAHLRDRIDRDSFVGLGATSLNAIELLALGERELRRRVDIARLLGTEALGAVLRDAEAVQPVPTAAPVDAPTATRPLLPGQRAMLAAHLAGADRAYHLLFSLDCPAELDEQRVSEAVDALVARHESLRTMFVVESGESARVVLPATHRPRLLRQALPDQDEAPWRTVHEQLATASPDLLQPYVRPPAVFVLTRAGRRSLLTLLVHHVLVDGWSIGLLWRELAVALSDGPGSVRSAGGQADLIGERLHAVTVTGELRRASDRLVRRLADAPSTLTLPTDRARPGQPDGSGSRLTFTLDPSVAEAVEGVARRCGATVTTVVAATWALVVSRRAGQRDLLLAMPFAGRSTAELARVVGLATRVVPVRARIDDAASVTEHVRTFAAALREAGADAEVPFERLLTDLGVAPDPARSPLTQVGFAAHHELVPATVTVSGHQATVREGHCRGAAFDAMLYLQSWQQRPRLALEYATAALGPTEAADLVESFRAGLAEVVRSTGEPLGRVRTISPEQHELLPRWGGGAPVRVNDDVWQAFERRARAHPDAAAVRDSDSGVELTYGQLHEHAVAQSVLLHEHGVRAGERVVVDLPRSAAEAVAVLAVLRLGASYVAVEAAQAPRGREQVVSAVKARVRIGRADTAGWPATDRCPPVDLSAPARPAGHEVPAAAPDPSRPVYVSFTSGSTGLPKGVVVPHRGVLRLARDADLFAPVERPRMLRLAPLAFDASTLELLVPLVRGDAVEVFPAREPSPGALAEFLAATPVTHAWLTSGLFHLVAEHRPEAFRTLRQLFTGGGVVSGARVGQVLLRCPGLRVSNGYGPTENTTFTTVHHVDTPDRAEPDLPIGRPIAGTSLWVRDDAGAPVPPGGVGELCVSGSGLADGYLADPERTAEAFVACDGERCYRTGDLVRWDTSGLLRYLGRNDRQVKISGHRVALDEVENLIRRQPGVSDAALFVSDDHGRTRLTAAVITEGGNGDLAALREWVEQELMPQARPQRWLRLDAFPLTRNGKVDLGALAARPPAGPAPAPSATDTDATPAVPSSADPDPLARYEELVGEAWSTVLGTDDFDSDEAFFDVGGDSLQLALVRNQLRERLPGRALPMTDLYRFPTVRALAEHLRAAEGRAG
ncbi:amino acid adenylation domain-containing protein [Micromonospora chalcea]